ncbi:MAG: MOSC domain-containing protein [Pyrinomonadaceae bacterium]
MAEINNLTLAEIEDGLDEIRKSPKDEGVLELIVARPKIGEREVLQVGELNTETGLVGDNWNTRKSWATKDKKPHPEMQINIMNSRAIALIAQTKERWQLAGDQLYVDFDLSEENLPPGSRLQIGSAVLEITTVPHNGCRKFTNRFGKDAVKFVNSKTGKQLHLRGLNAKVVKAGIIKTGNIVKKLKTSKS